MAKKFSMSDLLNEQSLGTGKAAKGQAFAIQQIPLEQIRPSQKNEYGVRNIEELATNIENFGLMHNITVCETSEAGVYEIISGERRYRAFKMLLEAGGSEYATIPCKVETREDDEFQELRLLFANATARELTDYEKTHQAMRIKELLQNLKAKGHKFKGRLRDIVAEMMDVSSSQVSKMEKIHDHLIPEFAEEFKDEKIGISAAYDLASLPQEEQQAALADYRESGKEAVKEATTKLKPAPVAATPPSVPQIEKQPVHTTEETSSPEIPDEPEVKPERYVIIPIQANEAQRSELVKLGKEAVQEFCTTDDPEKKLRFAIKIGAFTDVAMAFGVLDYEEEINDIPEYQAKYGENVEGEQ